MLSLVVLGGCWQSLVFLDLQLQNSNLCLSSLCVPSHGVLSVSVCFCVSSVHVKTPVTLNEGTTLLQCDLILIYISITYAKTHSQVPGVIASISLWGHNSTHSSRVDKLCQRAVLFNGTGVIWLILDCIIPLIWHYRKGKTIGDKNQSNSCQQIREALKVN